MAVGSAGSYQSGTSLPSFKSARRAAAAARSGTPADGWERVQASWVVPATWVFNMGVLFLNERYGGYRYAALHESLSFLVRLIVF